MPAYADAVIQEAASQSARLTSHTIDTVFIGGGTPSVLPTSLLKKMLSGVFSHFTLSPDAEFTTEANPGTLTAEWLDTAVSFGVNRLSLGMQAFQPQLLQTLGRIHHFAEVQQAVKLAQAAGIDNISLDLMFGLPSQTLAMWKETLDAALSLHPKHLSCYGLIPEPGTPMYDLLDSGTLTLPDEDLERTMYDTAITMLAAHGFQQYEISNFALPGYACKHNLGYWQQVPYLGLGASAASMLPSAWQPADPVPAYWRITNPSRISDYIRMVNTADWSSRIIEPITHSDAAFETWMLGLRTNQGVCESHFVQSHGFAAYQHYMPRLSSLEDRELIRHSNGFWQLTRRGMDIQNSILIELMDE